MLKVGITGGIGSGKTMVCRILEMLGIAVYYSDLRAKELMQNDELLISQIKDTFGSFVYDEAGMLDRRALAGLVFGDPVKLQTLNSLVHPAVFRDFDRWVCDQQKLPYVLKEAAILFESGSYRDCDFTILVKAPAGLRIKRVVERDGVKEEDVIRRMNVQMSEEEKEARADLVVVNDEAHLLIPQVLLLHEKFVHENNK